MRQVNSANSHMDGQLSVWTLVTAELYVHGEKGIKHREKGISSANPKLNPPKHPGPGQGGVGLLANAALCMQAEGFFAD